MWDIIELFIRWLLEWPKPEIDSKRKYRKLQIVLAYALNLLLYLIVIGIVILSIGWVVEKLNL